MTKTSAKEIMFYETAYGTIEIPQDIADLVVTKNVKALNYEGEEYTRNDIDFDKSDKRVAEFIKKEEETLKNNFYEQDFS